MPHSDSESVETDISFEFEDDDNLVILFEAGVSDGVSRATLGGYAHEEQNYIPLALKPSPNCLSECLYRPWRLGEYIMERMIQPAQKLKETVMLGCSLDELLVMLHYKKWLVDELTGDFYNDQDRLREKCGLSLTPNQSYPIKKHDDFMCLICCESGPMETFSLSCDHEFCVHCYGQYLSGITKKGFLAPCMDTQCNKVLYHSDVEKLLQYVPVEEATPIEEPDFDSDDEMSEPQKTDFNNYEMNVTAEYDLHFKDLESRGNDWLYDTDEPLLLNYLLQAAAKLALEASRKHYKWCPAVDCEGFVELSVDARPFEFDHRKNELLKHTPIVRCSSSHEFCFDCQYENHLPCSCVTAAKWIKRCQDDSETVNWIESNTQNCPRCSSLIEKNGGCNHMVCQHCSFKFCWICLHDWNQHTQAHWSCNRFHERKVVDTGGKAERQNALNRYLHYYKRFAVHQRSMKGDEKTLASIHRYMLLYMKSQAMNNKKDVSWNDAQFMSDAIRSLIGGRRTLMWSYAFMFYLDKSNYCDILEGMQDYLNDSVESLSKIFEDVGAEKKKKSEENIMKALTKKRTNIVHLSSLVSKRQRVLVECASQGLEDRSLIFRDYV